MRRNSTLTGAFGIAHRAQQHSGILALRRLSLLDFSSFTSLTWNYAICMLNAGAVQHLFNSFLFDLSTKVLQIVATELSLSWSIECSASSDGLGILVGMAGVDCFPADGTNVGDWVHSTREFAGRDLQKKASSVDTSLNCGRKRRKRTARAVVINTHHTSSS